MSVKAKITDDMKAAMKARETQRLSAIRLLLAAIQQREVDERKELSDAEVASVIEKMIKQRRDSIAQFQAAGRQDLAEKETFELNLLSGYLPKQLTDAEIGSEIAAALTMNEKKVTLIFPGHDVSERLFPRDLARYVSGIYKQKGVELVPGEKVVASEARGDQRALKTASGKTIVVDAVVAGIGIEPNTELAKAISLTTENGVIVNELLRTKEADIYAAGDVAVFYNPALGKRMRVEHEDNANAMGRLAGRNMAGKSEP